MSLWAYSLLLCFASCAVIFCTQPLVTISSGQVSGIDISLSNGRIVQAFLGIPYALPPVAENRFEEPKPFEIWEGTWNATTYTRSCVQFSLISNLVIGEEDCLHLNVFTPKLPNKFHQPLYDVIVWIHGGSFMFGTGNYLTPDYLLQSHDIVFVSINYRLAMFGFYSTDDDVVAGNNGLKDQVMALRWIKNNIKYFGGNPESVTIAGTSAGSASVHFLVLSPLAGGLFHKAIMASGTALQPWLLLGKTVPTISKQLASISGCPTDSSRSMVNCLKTRPAVKIAESYRNFQTWRHLGYLFGPVIEPGGKNRFLQDDPLILIRNKSNNIPCLISVVQNEGFVGLNNFVNNEEVLEELDTNFNTIAPYMLFYFHLLPSNQHSNFASEIRQYFFKNQSFITHENYPKLIQFLGDRLITSYVEFAIREHIKANFGPIYYSVFNYTGEYSIILIHNPKDSTKVTKVSHSDDMLYIMMNSLVGNKLHSVQDIEVSKLMTNIWATFAETGKPEINTKNITWPAVSKIDQNGLTFLRINSATDLEIENSTNTEAFNFWNNKLNEFSNNKKNVKDEL